MSKATGSGFRADIQGLRAIAVLVVLVFHVWPGLLPGGYVGVDVFFVISGYLITGLLVREFERSGTISLRDFYARRIRRLLPAASATLLAVALGGWWLASVSEWSGLARELVASALYVENWLLVQRSVDYLAQDAAPSPLQHYWSLSVEEQFYIVWPLLMLGTGWLARRAGLGVRGVFLSALSVVTLASLGYGIYVSFVDPAPGYFLTTTRVWELGIGGLLALMGSRYAAGRGWGGVLGWGGMAAIGLSAWFYSSRLPFPGYEALLPTLGAGALLFARVGGESVLGRFLGTRSMQYVGDISYSLYLWHWPVVVFYGPATGREVSTLQDGMLVVVVSFVLAHASKALLEERYRHGRPGETLRPYAIALCLTLAVTAAAIGLSTAGKARIRDSLPAPGPRTEVDALHPGALAWDGQAIVPDAPVMPAPDVARIDRQLRPGADERCIAPIEGSEVSRCVFGKADSSYRVVLVGDSHAEHWIPAFAALAERSEWRLEVIAKSGCALIDAEIVSGSSRTGFSPYPACQAWGERVSGGLQAQPPGLLVVSQSPSHRVKDLGVRASQRSVAEGVVRRLGPLLDQGIPVLVIRHTPWLPVLAPECVKAGKDCTFAQDDVLPMAALSMVAKMDARLKVLDMTDYFCREGMCPAVVGNVLVYRDQHHLTATYARTLATPLDERLKAALR